MHRNRNKGFTLMEVLVALAVLSIGLLGMAGMQLFSMKSSHSAYLQSQASYFAYDLIDKMRANPVGFGNGNYESALSTIPGSFTNCQTTTATCSPDQLAAFELTQWKCALGSYENDPVCIAPLNMTTVLPNGDGSVVRNGVDVTVTVQWQEGSNTESIMIMAEL
ncbi:MAG: type IV pilus modification protein PilV [Gammaproteobacteria bacterium]|nr:type IV pilus modification protein PilV [Gammaproteobacteria bacterium]